MKFEISLGGLILNLGLVSAACFCVNTQQRIAHRQYILPRSIVSWMKPAPTRSPPARPPATGGGVARPPPPGGGAPPSRPTAPSRGPAPVAVPPKPGAGAPPGPPTRISTTCWWTRRWWCSSSPCSYYPSQRRWRWWWCSSSFSQRWQWWRWRYARTMLCFLASRNWTLCNAIPRHLLFLFVKFFYFQAQVIWMTLWYLGVARTVGKKKFWWRGIVATRSGRCQEGRQDYDGSEEAERVGQGSSEAWWRGL